MSPPIKTSPSVSPGVCQFWIQGPSNTKVSSISHLTVEIDVAALKIDYKDLHYTTPAFGRTLDHYNQQIAGNITMNNEACSLFGCEVGGKTYPGYIQVYDENEDGTLSLGEVEAIRNPVHQQQFLSASYALSHENDPACEGIQLPKEQGYPEVAGKTIILKTPEAAMEAQRKYNEGEIFSRTVLILGALIVVGAVHMIWGRKVPVWRRVGRLIARKIFRQEGSWFLNGPTTKGIRWFFPSPRARAEAIAKKIESLEGKKAEPLEKSGSPE
jgi:hypothetical protein